MDSLLHTGLPVITSFAVGFILARMLYAKPRGIVVLPPDESISDAQIEAEVRAGHRVEAIKLYRRRHACGLAPAKQAIEALARLNA